MMMNKFLYIVFFGLLLGSFQSVAQEEKQGEVLDKIIAKVDNYYVL
jgi:hypothetical protein